MNTVLYIGIAILVLLVMITIHELGHYLVARWLKIKVEEFAVGFGPPIFKRKLKNGETFSLRVVPLGGYCAFKGGEDKDAKDPEDFNAHKPWKRILVLLGGVTFNLVSAFVFAFILLISFGYDIPQIKSVTPGTDNYGIIKEGDVVRAVNGEKIGFIYDTTFSSLLNKHGGINEWVELTVTRNGAERKLDIFIYADPDDATRGIIGVSTQAYRYSFIEALIWCVPIAMAMAWKILAFLGMLITGAIGLSAIGGPITTITTIADYSAQNIANLFVFLPFIAANLAVFNILPIPALDGSKIIFTTVEWIRKKPINRNVEAIIHFAGLIVLFAFVIFIDLFHLFT